MNLADCLKKFGLDERDIEAVRLANDPVAVINHQLSVVDDEIDMLVGQIEEAGGRVEREAELGQGQAEEQAASVDWSVQTDPVEVFDEFGAVEDVEDGPEYILIRGVETPSDARNSGLATQAMEQALREIAEKHPGMDVRLTADPLDSATDQERLVSFYEKFGFEQEEYQEGMSGIPMRLSAADLGNRISEEQAGRTNTPEFKQWFGESKVVDENGEPLVVYHGTQVEELFESFDPQGGFGGFNNFGSWFSSNPDAAAIYAKKAGDESGPIMPVHLSIQNPWETTWEDMLRHLKHKTGGLNKANAAEVVREYLISSGKDGVIIRDFEGDGVKQDMYVTLEPSQIKSVNNQGQWSKDDDRILYQTKSDSSIAGGMAKKTVISVEDIEGATVFPIFADLAAAGVTQTHVDGVQVEPTQFYGGASFPYLQDYKDNDIVWSVNKKGILTALKNKVAKLKELNGGKPVYITVMAMDRNAHVSNSMTVASLFRTLEGYVRSGHIPEETLISATKLIRSKSNLKANGNAELANMPDLSDVTALHKWMNDATFDTRAALVKVMRSATFRELEGMMPVNRIIREAADPEYSTTQSNDGLLVFEIDPDNPDLEVDYESKEVKKAGIPRHPAYRYGIRGKMIGTFGTKIPADIMYKDLLGDLRANSPKSNDFFLLDRLGQDKGQVITPEIVAEAKVIESLHDYRIAAAHSSALAGEWRDSDTQVNKGGLKPVEFELALVESAASVTLTKYTKEDLKKGKKDGSMTAFQLGNAAVDAAGLNVWMAVKRGYSYAKDYTDPETGLVSPEVQKMHDDGILTDEEVALVGVVNNEIGVGGMGTYQVLKAVEEGVTVLDAFKVVSSRHPTGLLPKIYATIGFEEVGLISFDPSFYTKSELKDLEAVWKEQGWQDGDDHPSIAVMKYRGDDNVRSEATRRFVLEGQKGLGIGELDPTEDRASFERIPDFNEGGAGGDGQSGQSDGRADPWSLRDRSDRVAGRSRDFIRNILSADQSATAALKIPNERIASIKERFNDSELHQNDDGPQGAFQPLDDGAVIRMFNSSNLSTFLHEAGHLFLNFSLQVGTADTQQILDFLGASSVDDVIVRPGEHISDEKRAMHEKFARAFELYLFEGKAPSADLRPAFARFTSWLKQVYTSMTEFGQEHGVELNAEIRGVFDRMLATDEQIQTTEAQNAYGAEFFMDPATAGMTESEAEDLRKKNESATTKATETLQEKILGQLKRTTEKWWKADRKLELEKAKDEVAQQPVHQALDFIKSKDEDGNVRKLDREAVAAMHDGKVPKSMERLVKKGGMNPDEAADLFGFESGQQMIEEMQNAPTKSKAANELADQRMLDKHGDILNDGTLEAEAQAAAHNENRGRAILAELRVLTRHQGVPAIDKKALKAHAERAIAAKRVKDLRPERYHAAEVRAAKRAQAAADAGDMAAALKFKQQQAANFYLFKEAMKAREVAEKVQRYVKKYSSKKVRSRLGKSGNGYLDQIDDLLVRFDFRKAPRKKDMQPISEWAVERSNRDGDEIILSALAASGESKHYREMTSEEISGVYDTLRNIDHQSLRSYEYMVGQEKLTFDQVKKMLLEKLEESAKHAPAEVIRSAENDKLIYQLRSELSKMTDMGSLTLWLDNNERAGLAHKLILQPINEAFSNEMDMWAEVARPIVRMISERSEETVKRHNTKVTVPALGTVYFHQLLSFALNLGTDSNLDKLARGEGIVNELGEPDMDAINQIVSHLKREDWDLVQTMWDQLDMLYEPMANVAEKQTGIRPPKLVHREVETPFGNYRGGYVPMKYDPHRSQMGEMNAAKGSEGVDRLFDSFAARPASEAGARHTRTGVAAPVLLSLDIIPSHLQETIHYITHYDAVRQINKLTSDKEIAVAIKASVGEEEFRQIRPWLNAIARDGQEGEAKGVGEKLFRKMRFGLTLGIMGFKASTGLMQFAGLSNAMAEVGAGHVYQAMRFLGSEFSWKSFQEKFDAASESSNVLAHRMHTMDRELRNAEKELRGKGTFMAKVQLVSMKHIALIQTYAVDLPSWYAAYNSKLAELQGEQMETFGATKENHHERAARYADWVVENVQGSGATKDLSATMRNQNEFYKQMTMFMTFFAKFWNRERTLGREVRAGQKDSVDVAVWVMFSLILPTLYEMVMRGKLDEPEEGEEDDRLQQMLTSVALTSVNGLPFYRDAANGLISGFDYNMSPLAGMLKRAITGSTGLVEAMFDEDKDITPGKVKSTVQGVGAVLGVPGVNQAWATGDAIYQMVTDKQDIDLRELIITGPERGGK